MARSEAARIFEEVLAGQASGPPVVLATVVQAPPDAAAAVGAKLLLRQDGSTLGSLGRRPAGGGRPRRCPRRIPPPLC